MSEHGEFQGKTAHEVHEEAMQVRRDDFVARMRKVVDKLWRVTSVLVGLVVVLLLVDGYNLYLGRKTGQDVLASRALSNQGRAMLCTVAALEVQRNYTMPNYCKTADVVVWVPPSVCPLFDSVPLCGTAYSEK